MVRGHRALLGILLLWPKPLHREWAHANGSIPNPTPNDPHVTHVGEHFLHPQGCLFSGVDQLNRWAGGAGGCKSLPEAVARGSTSASPTLGFLGSTNISSGEFSGSTTFTGVRNLSGTKRKKSPSQAPWHHDGSTFHRSHTCAHVVCSQGACRCALGGGGFPRVLGQTRACTRVNFV